MDEQHDARIPAHVRLDLAPTPGQAMGAGFGWTFGVALAGCALPLVALGSLVALVFLVAQPLVALVVIIVLIALAGSLLALRDHNVQAHARRRR